MRAPRFVALVPESMRVGELRMVRELGTITGRRNDWARWMVEDEAGTLHGVVAEVHLPLGPGEWTAASYFSVHVASDVPESSWWRSSSCMTPAEALAALCEHVSVSQ